MKQYNNLNNTMWKKLIQKIQQKQIRIFYQFKAIKMSTTIQQANQV